MTGRYVVEIVDGEGWGDAWPKGLAPQWMVKDTKSLRAIGGLGSREQADAVAMGMNIVDAWEHPAA